MLSARGGLLVAEDLQRTDRKAQGDPAIEFIAGESGTIAHWATPPSL